jgi:hypothetical protein
MRLWTKAIGRPNRRTRRSPLAGGRLLAGAAVAGLAVLSASSPASAQTLTWSIAPTPNPSTLGNSLQDVSCISTIDCTAVGNDNTTRNALHAAGLIESWNGSSWSVVPSPRRGSFMSLDGVSCVSATDCTAVGSYLFSQTLSRSLIESWNGTSWTITPGPLRGQGSALSSVSCLSATNCTAVGYWQIANGHERTLIESWNGTTWSVVPSLSRASNSTLDGVSCVSATDCTAVGDSFPRVVGGAGYEKTLVESWNGTSWSIAPTPNPSTSGDGLYSVSCTSATRCLAVGSSYQPDSDQQTLAESWDGTSWSVVPTADPTSYSNLNGLSCVSATTCTAVGYSLGSGSISSLIESWDGSSWSVVPSPSGPGGAEVSGVSCTSATACTAAGLQYSTESGSPAETLIETGTAEG